MPSFIVDYTPGSGFVPLFTSGTNPWSGQVEPVGGLQLRADAGNLGSIYVSLSGAFVFSGVVGCLPASGGPTIKSGGMTNSGGFLSGKNDAMPLQAGDSYYVPKIGFTTSGIFQVCFGCDPATSGVGRLYLEAF